MLPVAVLADVYMQYPPGSNNRLDEGGGNRNNNNRLMDTQNNAKGGYGYGGDANNKAAPLCYMAGSQLSMAWTSQHSCGSENAECQVVIQYMCNEATTAPAGVPTAGSGTGEGPIRDGTNNGTPDPNNPQANRGLHEPTSFYQACDNRERNKGLYTADQNLNGNDARRTRQNPNGGRSGLECPEERDYYPYWAPSPWKDLMIMTNNLGMCDYYKANSQNVVAKGYCTGQNGNQAPNNEAGCTADGGTWQIMPPFNIPPPECVAAPVQRDNHLGNTQSGMEVMANLSIPSGAGPGGGNDAQNCVMRIRYNITTADTRVCEDKTLTTKEACQAAGKIWSSFYLDSSYNGDDLNDNPPIPDQNPTVSMGGFLTDTGGTNSLLELAINTNQYGRTFQDRTHTFDICDVPSGIPSNVKIYNLNVKGKRGNIVQTYPATEYDFHPNTLEVGSNDMVHIQWTGNDNTNNNGNNNGEGTNDEDRHNIVQLDNTGMDVPLPADQANMFDVQWEWNPEPATSQFGGSRDRAELTKQFALVKQTGCAQNPNNDQQRSNCEKLNAAAATVNLGLLKFKPGEYKYMSSRNNNFSNRAQKAMLRTLDTPEILPREPSRVSVTPIPNDVNPAQARMLVSWSPPGSDAATIGTDGKEYWAVEQIQGGTPGDYKVERSCDGGLTWVTVPECRGNVRTCEVTQLPAGTTCGFRVRGATVGGWGVASTPVMARTLDSGTSSSCTDQVYNEISGMQSLSNGTIVAIVLGVIAGVLFVAFSLFMLKRRTPPPPPPEFKMQPGF